MNAPPPLPYLPESAPFTPEQRAYLNGFLAGLFSRVPAVQEGPGPSPAQPPLTPLSILFGSQTGTSEGLAKRIAKQASQRGFAPTVHDLAKYPLTQLAGEYHLLFVSSTYGDGDPPDNAQAFWQFLSGESAPRLAQLRFSVCALGDSNYPKFCAFGKNVDERLAALGAQRVAPRADCDVDCEEPFVHWLESALGALTEGASSSPVPSSLLPAARPAESGAAPAPPAGHSRAHPFLAPLVTNRRLNGEESSKDTRHLEFSLEGSGMTYEAGDALGVFPTNCPELVGEILRALGCRGTEPVPGRDGEVMLHDALLRDCEITKIPSSLLQELARRTGDAQLVQLTSPGVNGELTKFLWGREIIDLLLAFPAVRWAPGEFVRLLKKLSPRLYSISSSPRAHPGQVHLTTAVVRYQSLGRHRRGVCSTFLADSVPTGGTVPVFVQPNKHFRPPADPARPMILVGPGTGIAPFRAFLHERRATGGGGRNWLFFGDQHAATDFLYREELAALQHDGTLTRLDTAFSRDQAEKLYVQHRMLEQARELFAWLEDGAHFYVCGDAKRMAKDVDAALSEVVIRGGARTAEEAAAYVQDLKSGQRYQRDVY
jgi:sulfite reductase (NADPH) flavoprotein alpha-component